MSKTIKKKVHLAGEKGCRKSANMVHAFRTQQIHEVTCKECLKRIEREDLTQEQIDYVPDRTLSEKQETRHAREMEAKDVLEMLRPQNDPRRLFAGKLLNILMNHVDYYQRQGFFRNIMSQVHAWHNNTVLQRRYITPISNAQYRRLLPHLITRSEFLASIISQKGSLI